MLKSKKTLIVCLAVFGLGMGTMHAGSALAGPGGKHWAQWRSKAGSQPGNEDCPIGRLIHERLGKLFDLRDELNITPEQRASIRTIVQNHRDDLKPVLKGVIEKHRTLHTAVLADETDEQAIRAAANDLGGAIGDAAVVAAQVAKEVKAVLTPEQLQVLRDFRADRQDAVDAILENLGDE